MYMCEPIQGKKKNPIDEFNIDVPTDFYEECYMFDAKDIKSAANFYKKYESKPISLKREKNNSYKEWIKYKEANYLSTFDKQSLWQLYNNWLFDYTFKDVIE